MNENKGENIGCMKAIAYLGVAVFVIIIIAGALEGITDILNKIPWYIYIFVLIGFWYIMAKYFQ